MNPIAVQTAFARFLACRPAWMVLATALVVSGCGGGGGGGGGGGNVAPTASFTATPISGPAPLLVDVDASASSDPDGTIASYTWSFGDSSSGTGAVASHTYAAAGTYTIKLTVKDSGGKSASTSRTVTVDPNNAPTAAYTISTATGTVPFVVNVDGGASSDSDGTVVGYAWDFGDGSTAAGATASHNYATGGIYNLKLTVTDDGGASGTYVRQVLASDPVPVPAVTVSGTVQYERIPFSASSSSDQGLNYTGRFWAPIRGALVELVRPNGQFIAATVSDQNGAYTLDAPQNTDAFVRVRAQSVGFGAAPTAASWSIAVRNNTNANALYMMVGSTFNTGTANVTRNLSAESGWPQLGGTTYISDDARVAGPFAILDSMYKALRFVVQQGSDTAIALPALDVFWSPKNQSSDTFNPATGNIVTTQYWIGASKGIYVLGKDGVDTDEYDESVITHEFSHYFTDVYSRDDTVGGAHSFGEKLDMRVAFSEGYANAFSAMVLVDPLYRDSYGSAQGQKSSFSLESTTAGTAGWYNEASMSTLAYDLYDAAADAGDSVSLSFASLQTAFHDQLRVGQALTSMFPLIDALKDQVGAPVAGINTLVQNSGMVATTLDAFGSTETNNGGNGDALPLYSNLTLNGPAVKVCGNRLNGYFNKLGNRRLLKFSLAAATDVTITAKFTTSGSDPILSTTVAPDPDIVLYKGSFLAVADSSEQDKESMVRTLGPGDYVVEVYEYSHIEAPSAANQTARGRTCMNVTITG